MEELIDLSKICEIIMGQSPDSSYYNIEKKGVPFYQGNADFGQRNPIARIWCNKPTKLSIKDDILISVRAPIGALNLADETCCIGRGLAALRVNESYLRDYIYYCLKSKVKELALKGTGSTFKAINRKQLEEMRLPNICIVAQQKIVAELDTISEVIAKKKEQIKNLDLLVKSQFVEMFGDPIENPKGWEIVKIGDMSESFIGLTYSPENVAEDGTLVLRSSNVRDNELCFKDTVRVKLNVREKLIVKNDDILMCSRNGSARLVGKVALIEKLTEPMTFGAFMTIVRSKYFRYIFEFFKSEGFRSQLGCSSTTTVNQITKSMLDNVKIALPPLSLQNQFANFVTHTEKLKEQIKSSLLEAENCYNSLMQKYFD